MPGTDRLSNSSFEDAPPPQPRPFSLLPAMIEVLPDGSELIPTRNSKTTAPKPAANPLQFIKVGPCDLYKAAQEQLKKVEEIKKVEKTVKEDCEDWQSNLDHWKCSRRKRQEHIIDRVVEVKKLELEEHERNKRRGKTLNEMIQERSEKGVGPRKASLMVYPDEDPTDLTDLGISLDKSSVHSDVQETADSQTASKNVELSGTELSDGTGVSLEAEEYTYERAIEGYKSFAEKSVKGTNKPRVSAAKPGGRIGEKLQELEQVRLRSNSVSDIDLPKVDINKRRSMFEVVESADTKSPSAERIAKDLAGASIVKQRLSSLNRQPDLPLTPINNPEMGPALKDCLSTLDCAKNELHRRVVNDECSTVGKGSAGSNFSDEELGPKEIISPDVSDREVSSPLVSDCISVTVGMEVVTNKMVEGVADESLDFNTTAQEKSYSFSSEAISHFDLRLPVIVDGSCQNTASKSDVVAGENAKDEFEEGREIKSEQCQNQSASIRSNHMVLEHISSIGPCDLLILKGPKPSVRARKLTPITSLPPSSVSEMQELPPFPSDLSVIGETVDEEEAAVPPTAKIGAIAQGAETSESGIDMEESSLYTDENIDEVLGEDDYDDTHEDVPDSASELQRMRRLLDQPPARHEAVTRFDVPEDLPPTDGHLFKQSHSVARLDELIAPVRLEHPTEAQTFSGVKEPIQFVEDFSPRPFIEDNQATEMLVDTMNPAMDCDTLIASNQAEVLSASDKLVIFPLSPTSSVEPPKEKPPPPPVDVSGDDEDVPPAQPKSSVRRNDSTKRIKKEIRKKRSDFLGIEGMNDDTVFEPEVAPPPDMLTLLEEERKLEKLYRQSLSSDADSTEGTNSFMSNRVGPGGKPINAHEDVYELSSRDSGVELDRTNSEELCWNKWPDSHLHPHKVKSELITEIEREGQCMDPLENQQTTTHIKLNSNEATTKDTLSEKLRLLEEEKLRLEWVRAEEEGRRMADEERLEAKEMLLRQQATLDHTNQSTELQQDNLKAERERLEQEQLELARVRQDLLTQKQRPAQGTMGSNLRYSLPNLQDTMPPLPQNPRQFSSWSRIPSAENLLDNSPRNSQQQQQMTRTTLHALSATSRPRIVNGDTWIQPKRKTDSTKGSYNYRHWLIQEAEHRRITEQQQRALESRRSLPAGHIVGHPAPPRPSSDYSPVHVAPPSDHLHPHGELWPHQHNALGLPPAPTHNHSIPHHTPNKPLPEAIIQTLTQRAQIKISPKRRPEERPAKLRNDATNLNGEQERMLSVSGKKKCSHCGDELGRGAAMVIESLRLFYHIDCFKCCVCHTQLGDGLMGTDVRVRNNKLHCHNCYSSDDGVKFSCV